MTNEHQTILGDLARHLNATASQAVDAAIYGPEAMDRNFPGESTKSVLSNQATRLVRSFVALQTAGVIEIDGFRITRADAVSR